MAYLLRLLGPAAIEGPNGVLSGPISQRHRLALLALLSRAPRNSVSRDRLVALLWPDADRLQSRRLLNAAVYAIRQVLGKDALIIQGDVVGLAEGALESDAARFESAIADGRFSEAAALYAGVFLEGLVLPRAGELDRWVEDERVGLEAGYRRVLDALASAASREGRPAEACDWLKRRVARDPTDGRATLALMRAMDRLGERAAALQLAATHASLLRLELEAEPDPQVEGFAAELRRAPIRAPEPVITAPPPPLPPPVPATVATEASVVVPRLVAVIPDAVEFAPVATAPQPDAGLVPSEAPPEPTVRGWIRIGASRRRAAPPRSRGVAVVFAALAIVAVALGGSSADLAAAFGIPVDEADVVVFPFRVRASPEYAYMGEVIAEEMAADIGEQTLLSALDPDRLRRILNGPPSPRQEQELGARLARRLWITGTVTQIGDSLLVRIVVQSESSIREGAFVTPARHQDPRLVAAVLVSQVLAPEVAHRAQITRRLSP